jgi:hypothetical protein
LQEIPHLFGYEWGIGRQFGEMPLIYS